MFVFPFLHCGHKAAVALLVQSFGVAVVLDNDTIAPPSPCGRFE